MASKIRRRSCARPRFNGRGLLAVRLAFAHKFGRLPGGDDPVFFDPESDLPRSLPAGGAQRLMLEAMLEYGTAPKLIYAYCRTGFAVCDETRATLSPDTLARWDAAIDEYFAFDAKSKSIQH